MSEYPILFTSKLVRAILDGRKTQTRRIIRPQPNYMKQAGESDKEMIANIAKRKCPYGKIGDTLWVRESFAIFDVDGDEDIAIGYKADDTYKTVEWFKDKRKEFGKLRLGKWRSSLHLHRWAARIFLEITNIRVEEIRDIDAVEAEAEGIRRPKRLCPDRHDEYILERFQKLWDSINASRGYGWDENPWVRVIEFKNITKVVK